ncbi:MAG: ATP-binding protein [Acidobacteriota bacterium]
MQKFWQGEIRSTWLRYGLALLLFSLTISLALLLQYAGIKINLTIPVVLALVVTCWYGGRGPGFLISILFQATTIYFTQIPAESSIARAAFGYFSVFSLYIFLVLLISGLRNIQFRLRDQGELLQVTLTSIGDAVIATDIDGRISFLNPTAENLTGWLLDDACGKPLEDIFKIIDQESRATVESPFNKIKRDGAVVSLANHTILVRKDGSELHIDDSGAPIRDSSRNIIGAVIVFHDVSERRQVEQERERLLRNEQSARADAETANRLKDEFLATVSHELRTPLNAIVGWSSMLQQGEPTAEQIKKALSVIERNAKIQNELIGDILDVSQIVSGKVRLDRKSVDLVPIIRGAVDTLYPAASDRSITIETSFEAANTVIDGDAERLQQIFSNLLSNAIKFTDAGGSINVRLFQQSDEIVAEFADTGVGISAAFLPFVFDRFSQIDTSTRRTYGGLGLGLAIVRHLVELHGGHASVVSDGSGKGSTFSVAFPMTPAAADNSVKTVSGDGGAPDLSGLRVLIVDDHEDTLEMFTIALEHHGATTRSAHSCSDALEKFRQWRPDVLISDLGMPGEDGYDLINQIRSLGPESGGSVPAAAVSAYTREEDCKRALAAGFHLHLSKPIAGEDLAAAVLLLSRNKYESSAPG